LINPRIVREKAYITIPVFLAVKETNATDGIDYRLCVNAACEIKGMSLPG